jgi:mannose-6-phosphate isomerase-like protein (cupin superfamily)
MGFSLLDKKGLNKCLIDTDLDPEKVSIHISEIMPGQSSHASHTHVGVEAIYVFYGEGIMEVEKQKLLISHNETILMDANKSHCLTNTGTEPLRYMVIKTN